QSLSVWATNPVLGSENSTPEQNLYQARGPFYFFVESAGGVISGTLPMSLHVAEGLRECPIVCDPVEATGAVGAISGTAPPTFLVAGSVPLSPIVLGGVRLSSAMANVEAAAPSSIAAVAT